MPETTDNIALIGFMAAGKTTVGRKLATHLGYRYVDIDELIAAQAEMTIPDIFAAEGEAGFRERERAAVLAASEERRLVISCGGGVIRDPLNVVALRRGGRVVLLAIHPATAARRLMASPVGRPLIDDFIAERTYEHVLARVKMLLRERGPAYRAAADQIVAVDRRAPAEVVARILSGESDAC